MTPTALAAALAVASLAVFGAAHAQDTLRIPNLAFRTGPYADTGGPLMNGQRDYMTMINERDGGVNGVLLGYEECETASSTEKGVECYENAKATALVSQPWSPGLALQLLALAPTDKVPVLAPGYGSSMLADGKTFQWGFNPPATAWDSVSMILSNVAGGSLDAFEGKTIALLYLEGAFGEDPIPLLETFGKKHGFGVMKVAVTAKEMQNQTAQWQEIAKAQPDLVLLWGWGSMNATALGDAAKAGFPMNRIVGGPWSSDDGDLVAAGEAAKGYRALTWNVAPKTSQALRDVRTYVIDKGKSTANLAAGEPDRLFYQRGLLISMMTVEAIRVAQQQYNTQLISADHLRWGLENLNLGASKLKEVGVEGMIAPFWTSCADHSGHAGAWMLEWDGQKFIRTSDLLKPEISTIKALEAAKSRDYAAANKPWPKQTCN